jgi:hypothetical protein
MDTSTITEEASLTIIDESFDLKKADQYHLSLILRTDSYSYAILDTTTQKYIALYTSLSFTQDDLFKQLSDRFKNVSFRSGTLALATPQFTMVPDSLFDESKKAELLTFCYEPIAQDDILFNTIHNLHAKIIFPISKVVNELIHPLFKHYRVVHSATAFIEGLILENKNNSDKKTYADFHADFFQIVITEGKNILFCNSFAYKTAEDIAYYILFLYEQLGLNPEEIPLTLSGMIEKTSAEHSLLFNYIRHVRFANLPSTFKYSYKIESLASHSFHSLFNQYLCE